MLASFVIVALALLSAVLRSWKRGRPGKTQVVIPSLVAVSKTSRRQGLRHLPAVLVFLGLPLFLLALADPVQSFVREEVSARGRRIALLVDASGSMAGKFPSQKLKSKQNIDFFTAVAAAEHFVTLRMKGQYRDLISLIEFGEQAYVITPFTDDYDTVLMSLSLIGEPEEWLRFPEAGTVIMRSINQGVALFKLFGYLRATGNIMVLITDGEDTQVILDGVPLDSVLREAQENHIPIYMIRTGYGKAANFDDNAADLIWSAAVRKTGGQFYAGTNEDVVLAALKEIDRAATGNVVRTRYGSRQPRFAFLALVAALLWTAALGAWLSCRCFRRFP